MDYHASRAEEVYRYAFPGVAAVNGALSALADDVLTLGLHACVSGLPRSRGRALLNVGRS